MCSRSCSTCSGPRSMCSRSRSMCSEPRPMCSRSRSMCSGTCSMCSKASPMCSGSRFMCSGSCFMCSGSCFMCSGSCFMCSRTCSMCSKSCFRCDTIAPRPLRRQKSPAPPAKGTGRQATAVGAAETCGFVFVCRAAAPARRGVYQLINRLILNQKVTSRLAIVIPPSESVVVPIAYVPAVGIENSTSM